MNELCIWLYIMWLKCNEIMSFRILSDFNYSRFCYGFLLLKPENTSFYISHSENYDSVVLVKPSLKNLAHVLFGTVKSNWFLKCTRGLKFCTAFTVYSIQISKGSDVIWYGACILLTSLLRILMMELRRLTFGFSTLLS